MSNPARPPTFSLQEIVRLSRDFEARMAHALGVNATDLAAMEHLISSGPLGPAELARRLKLSPPAVTAAVDRLLRVGHVTRSANPQDRRAVVITAAPPSVAKALDVVMPMVADVDATLDGFSLEEQATIAVYLDRVVAAYRMHVDEAATNTGTAD